VNVTTTMSATPDRYRGPEGDVGLRELMAAREIVHAFITAERPEEVFQFALDRVCPLIGATFGCVYVIDEGTELMRLAAVHNWPGKYAKFLSQMRVRLGHGPSGLAASERRTIEVLDLFQDPSLADWREVAKELGFRSFVALPLQTPKAVLGTVTFYFSSPNAVSRDTRHLVRMVADQMAATAEKARLIQDLKRANVALTASNAQLEQQYADALEARRVKDSFLQNISHELRTPLTAVMGYTALLEEEAAGPINDEQRHTLEQVSAASEHLLSLIGDLLELTALKRGALDLELAELDPRTPMREALAAAKGRRDGVALDVVEPDIVPPMIGDGRMLSKVIRILLTNAFKFTRIGTVRATLEIAKERAIYLVTDTGIGIPPDAIHSIFDEFRQVDSGLTREYGGSGLGLALGRRLARLLHGDITVTSMVGHGSTFRLDVPLRAPRSTPAH
jgi:signal transduction histidine kinase